MCIVHRYIDFWVGKLVEKSFIFLGVEEHPKFPKKNSNPKLALLWNLGLC